MARIRSIHPTACDSEKLAAVSSDAERLFWRLQTHLDDEGRCEDDPRIVNARCLPLVGWSADFVDGLLWELADVRSTNGGNHGLLVRYHDTSGRQILQAVKFDEFQNPRRPQKSTFDAPVSLTSDPIPDNVGTGTDIVGTCDTRSGVEWSGDGEGGEAHSGHPVTTPMSTCDLAARRLLRPTDFVDELEGHVLLWEREFGEAHVRMVLDSTTAKVRYPSALRTLIESRLPDADREQQGKRPEQAEARRNRDCELCLGSGMATDDDGAYPCPTCNP